MKRYIREVKEAGLREPEFIEWPNAIRVNVYRTKVDGKSESRAESKGQSKGESKGEGKGENCAGTKDGYFKMALEKLSANPSLTIPELAQALNLSVSGVEKIGLYCKL